MIAMVAVILLLVAAAGSLFWPLRRRRDESSAPRDRALDVARDAKLRELTDLELDFRLGKLSEPDFRSLSATLRAEAIEIIRQMDGERV